MDKKLKGIITDAKVKMHYENISVTEVFQELDETIKADYGVNITFVPAEKTSTDVVVDTTELLTHLSMLGTESGHQAALTYLRSTLLTGKAFQQNINFRRNVGEEALKSEGFVLGEVISSSLTGIQKLSKEVANDNALTRKRLKGFKYSDNETLSNILTRSINLPIPYTDKRITIVPKSLTEITLTIKEFLKMVSLFGTLILLLEKRITDWVLLKGAMYVVWGYVFWLLANELFHIRIIDINDSEQEALDAFRSNFLNMKHSTEVTP